MIKHHLYNIKEALNIVRVGLQLTEGFGQTLSIYLSIYLYLPIYICLPIYLSLYLSTSSFIYLYTSISLAISRSMYIRKSMTRGQPCLRRRGQAQPANQRVRVRVNPTSQSVSMYLPLYAYLSIDI